tara:strand:+ start:365 stop:1000 length:636 start_codon:yes stop_codon:yes gene_type:complete
MGIDKKIDFNIIGDKDSAKLCLIFIHGWKGNKSSFKRIAQSFDIKDSVWVLPQAPYLIEEGQDGYSWTYEISPGKYEREEPIQMLLDFFETTIFSEFNSKDVYLFGFSQGGLVCYEMIRILEKTLGGVFPIGGFMAGTKKKIKRVNSAQLQTPIIIGHGDSDEVILKKESEIAYKLLSKESNYVDIDIYKGGHKIGLGYIKKIKEFIERKY